MKTNHLAPAMISILFTFYIGDAFSRDYQGAGETSDSFILVDADQLRSMMLKGSTVAFIKTIRHYKTKKNLGLGADVQSEGYFMVVDCTDKSGVKFIDRRFYDSKLKIIKEIDYTEGGFNNLSKMSRTKITPGSAEFVAVDYACSWIEANK